MDVPRDQFFARTRFAVDEDGGRKGNRTANDVKNGLHRFAFADNVSHRRGFRHELAQLFILDAQCTLFDGLGDDDQ